MSLGMEEAEGQKFILEVVRHRAYKKIILHEETGRVLLQVETKVEIEFQQILYLVTSALMRAIVGE